VQALGYAFALAIGLTLGMLGGGGSILTVPVFVYVLGYDPKLAIAMSLPVVGVTSLVGAIGHWRADNVRVRTALLFGVFTMAAAYVAARYSIRLQGRAQLLILGVAILSAALLMLRDSLRPAPPAPATVAGDRSRFALPLAGLAVGVLTGLVGAGGGFLIVPALVLLAAVPMRQAIGTSLTVIAMNTAAGFAGLRNIATIPWAFVLTFGAVAVTGIIVGTVAARHVRQTTLKRGFAVFLLTVAILLVWQNWGRGSP